MELLSTVSHYILQDRDKSLWINRRTCQFSYESSNQNELASGVVCLGIVYGFIGKVQFGEKADPRLVFVRQRSLVGILKGCDVFKITSVVALPLESDCEVLLEPCPDHHLSHQQERNLGNSNSPYKTSALNPNNLADPSSRNYVKTRPPPLSVHPSQQNSQYSPKKQEREDKVEKRMLDEFYKMFTEADSFYYSYGYDLTNSIQRTALSSEKTATNASFPLWYKADLRFFWNYYMMSDLIQSLPESKDHASWVLPVVQGFVQYEHCVLNHLFDPIGPAAINVNGSIDIWLISRRSRFRAGTRYLKRGIDENGKVANYVETEQIMIYKKHFISFVLTRGSVPLFWSQPGFRYRPPPQLERSSDENYSAFRKHVEEEGKIYGPIIIINLMDKTGKEKVLGDAFLDIVLRHNSPELSYFSFDFHDNCRGMHFENVQLLIDKLDERFKSLNYCWVDSYGIVQNQTGVCRVNCVDCLDRTNVVQTFLAKHILCVQLCKLGLVSPEFGLPDAIKKSLQALWANNGDTISKQYAGTSALKSDYTRTGERRIAGALKDGMNSANRYYLNRFRDAYRQAIIDIMLGIRKSVTEDELESDKLIEERENIAEQLKAVLEDARKCVIPKFNVILGSWGLVNARENDPIIMDVDTLLILTETHYYVTRYDCTMDSITETERVKLTAIASIELGYEVPNQSLGFLGLFGSGAHSQPNRIPTLRINYTSSGKNQFHQFRSSNMRFFNNVCVPIHQPEEMLDALKLIAETIHIGATAQGNDKITLDHAGQIGRRKNGSNAGLPGNSWTQRYLSFNLQEPAQGRTQKLSKSIEKFTPKYFRRSSAADAARREAIGSVPVVKVVDIKGFKGGDEEAKEEGYSNTMKQGFDQSDLVMTGVEPTDLSRLDSGDLLLQSCGILSVPNVTLQRHVSSFSPSFLAQLSKVNIGSSRNATSPTSTAYASEIEGGPDPVELCVRPAFMQHRFSLPTTSLSLTTPRISMGGVSPLMPEIKITEEPRLDSGSICKGTIPLRMSKSSEDVVRIANSAESSAFVSTPRFIRSELKPISSESARSTSDQDIPHSSSLEKAMKGSHSESSIQARNRLQKLTQIGSVGNPSFKKDVVLAPFGKLANYLQTKKLKEAFKPQGRRGVESPKQDGEVEHQILQEKKRNSKSLIVDV